VSKDRAAPFSRKHRKYWIPILGGMILIGLLNLIIGFVSYEPPSDKHEKIKFDLPPPTPTPHDAAIVDAPTPPN